ncbi:MAG: hypothetical protein ACWA5T_08045 [Parvularcula sp.]
MFGLAPEFLQNLIAEGMGTILGVLISVSVAVWLDRQREKKRHVDHRGRAVTRWVKNHADMIEQFVIDTGHGSHPLHAARALASVREVERNASDIRADYATALDRKPISEAFEEYIRSLNNISTPLTGGSEADMLQLAALLDASTDKLKKLVRAAGARRSILQSEPVFKGLPKELLGKPE